MCIRDSSLSCARLQTSGLAALQANDADEAEIEASSALHGATSFGAGVRVGTALLHSPVQRRGGVLNRARTCHAEQVASQQPDLDEEQINIARAASFGMGVRVGVALRSANPHRKGIAERARAKKHSGK